MSRSGNNWVQKKFLISEGINYISKMNIDLKNIYEDQKKLLKNK